MRPVFKNGLTYWLQTSMYISLTNRACGLALLPSRGPGFVMPIESGFRPLEFDAEEPVAKECVDVVAEAYASDPRKANPVLKRNDGGHVDPGVVFAGLGDPLLRLEVLCEAIEGIRDVQPDVPVHLNTNGLAAHDDIAGCVEALSSVGVSSVTVALNASTPDSYNKVMLRAPEHLPEGLYGAVSAEAASALAVGDVPKGASFATVCNFISSLADAGIPVTATVVDLPGASVGATRQLAMALGATSFKVRSWHGLV